MESVSAHLPLRIRREWQTYSSPPCLSPCPTDSGYGSTPASPHCWTPKENRRESRLDNLLDGNYSFDRDDPFQDNAAEYSFQTPARAAQAVVSQTKELPGKGQKSATVPRRTPRSRPPLPAGFYSDTRIRFGQRGSGSLRLPDRFIPLRTQSKTVTEKFKTGKTHHELTPSERLLRHQGATEDAFCYRRRTAIPMASDFRAQFRSDTATSRNRVATILGTLDQNRGDGGETHESDGTVWPGGRFAPGRTAVNNGRGQLVRSGTNARLFRTTFSTAGPRFDEELLKHEARLATALGLDRAQRVLDVNFSAHKTGSPFKRSKGVTTRWNGTEWVSEGHGSIERVLKPPVTRLLPIAPFKVLDAPNLRDDFYCSVLSYSRTSRTLAVGLGDLLYAWSESNRVQLLNAGNRDGAHLTSVAFSSTEGCKCILAYGRSNRTLGLMSLYDDPEPGQSSTSPMPRFEVLQPAPVACLSWKPTCTIRPSKSLVHPGIPVKNEDLLVGDEIGHVYYYAVEWPERWEVERNNWSGHMTLLARITIHVQQVCGLSWSSDGGLFATGGNDNLCCLFETRKVSEPPEPREDDDVPESRTGPPSQAHAGGTSDAVPNAHGEPRPQMTRRATHRVRHVKIGDEKHRWVHGAAVKAIAFCPWQEGLVATGGGSNDKCIHFFHTSSGAALATIAVSAQVTSLIWSTTRREIAATFGYAEPQHTVRIAVFSWPDCRQVAAIPWAGGHRALYAVPYPGGPIRDAPDGNRGPDHDHTAIEAGCIMVASSDRSVKFHEVWSPDKRITTGGVGMLGGSDILESLEGIDREGDIIR